MDADGVSTYKDARVPLSDYIVEMDSGSPLSTRCRISLLPQKRVYFKRLNTAGEVGAVFLIEWSGLYSPVSSRASALHVINFVSEAIREVVFCRTTRP